MPQNDYFQFAPGCYRVTPHHNPEENTYNRDQLAGITTPDWQPLARFEEEAL